MHSANFGISGDRTENVLWRLHNGELEDVSPKIIVLSVGQENYGDSAETIAEGIRAICAFIRSKQPQAFLVLLVRTQEISGGNFSLNLSRLSFLGVAPTVHWESGMSESTCWWRSTSRGTAECSWSTSTLGLCRYHHHHHHRHRHLDNLNICHPIIVGWREHLSPRYVRLCLSHPEGLHQSFRAS